MFLFVFKVPFLSLIGKWLLFFSTILYTVLSLIDHYSIFKAETNGNRARSLKVVIIIVIIIIIIIIINMIIIILHNQMMWCWGYVESAQKAPVPHILAGCSALAQSKYLERDNSALKVLFFELLQDLKLIDSVHLGTPQCSQNHSTIARMYRPTGIFPCLRNIMSLGPTERTQK